MARTEKQIAEFMAYYSTTPKAEREWALEYLAEQEGMKPEEIRAIYEKYNGLVNLRRGTRIPGELKERVKEKARAGMSTADIVKEYGISTAAVDRIKLEMRNSGENIPDLRVTKAKPSSVAKPDKPETIPQREPEAYPGQIYDDAPSEPEPLVEEDVKVFIPGEEEEKKCSSAKLPSPIIECGTAHVCKPSGLWFDMRDNLREHVVGMLGAGTELIEEHVNSVYKEIDIKCRTVDGKVISCSLREETNYG